METGARLTPTIFDKLVADVEISGLKSAETPDVISEMTVHYPVPEIKRFGEAALRATVKRDLAWLLNTTQFGARGELELLRGRPRRSLLPERRVRQDRQPR